MLTRWGNQELAARHLEDIAHMVAEMRAVLITLELPDLTRIRDLSLQIHESWEAFRREYCLMAAVPPPLAEPEQETAREDA